MLYNNSLRTAIIICIIIYSNLGHQNIDLKFNFSVCQSMLINLISPYLLQFKFKFAVSSCVKILWSDLGKEHQC